MREIEVKAKINNPAELIKKFEELGCVFSEPIEQDDRIYIQNGKGLQDLLGKRLGMNILRIREQGHKKIFTLKQSQEGHMDSLEYETEISDDQAMEKAILALGFYQQTHVHKIRRKTKCSEYEICVDSVDGLGDFIEVEKLVEDADGPAVQEELFQFLQKFGISREDRQKYGYDILILLQQEKKN